MREVLTVRADDGGEGDDFSTLGEAVEIARADTSVEIHVDPRDLVPDKGTGWSPVGHVLWTVNYLDRKKVGRLVFIRTALTKDAPLNAKTYRRKNPDFPHDPTLDQSFDEEQFEVLPGPRGAADHRGRRAGGEARPSWFARSRECDPGRRRTRGGSRRRPASVLRGTKGEVVLARAAGGDGKGKASGGG